MDSKFLTPEVLAALTDAVDIDPQQASLAAQLEQARALRNRPHVEHSTGIGAALGGLGDVLGSVASYRKEGQLLGKQDALNHRQSDANRALIEAYLRSRALPGGPGPAPAPVVAPGAAGPGAAQSMFGPAAAPFDPDELRRKQDLAAASANLPTY